MFALTATMGLLFAALAAQATPIQTDADPCQKPGACKAAAAATAKAKAAAQKSVPVPVDPCQTPGACKAAPPRKQADSVRYEPMPPQAYRNTAIKLSLAQQIIPFFKRCAPGGADANLMITKVELRLSRDGALTNVVFLGQSGLNDLNRPLAEMHKRCAINSVKTASPYKHLPAELYDQWKIWPMAFKSR